MTIWMTSDLHLGHRLASNKRGYGDDIDDHDDAVVESFADLGKRDVLYILGDVAFKKPALLRLRDIPCRTMYLLLGNHDQFSAHSYLAYVHDIIGPISYHGVWLSHMPIVTGEMRNRAGNIHGHIHLNEESRSFYQHPYFNVNWDFHEGPLAFDDIRATLASHE